MIRLRPHRVGKAESLFVENLKPFSTASANTRHRIRHVRFAEGIATSQACSMKSRATGPSVRFLSVTMPTGTRARGKSMDNSLTSALFVGNLKAETGKIDRK